MLHAIRYTHWRRASKYLQIIDFLDLPTASTYVLLDMYMWGTLYLSYKGYCSMNMC